MCPFFNAVSNYNLFSFSAMPLTFVNSIHDVLPSYEARWPRNCIFRLRSAGELYKNGCRGSGPSIQNQPTQSRPILRTDVLKRWAVYLILHLLKSLIVGLPITYMGSGTERANGVASRFNSYENEHSCPTMSSRESSR